jgi:hypothetical protein
MRALIVSIGCNKVLEMIPAKALEMSVSEATCTRLGWPDIICKMANMEPWRREWDTFADTTTTTNDVTQDLRILRVNQLDAERLDMEIGFSLSAYFKKIFQFFDVRKIMI